MYLCIIWVSETKQKRYTAQVYNPIYHVKEPVVLCNDKVLLAIPQPTEFVQTVSKGVCYKWPHSYFEACYSQVCNSLQFTLNGLL